MIAYSLGLYIVAVFAAISLALMIQAFRKNDVTNFWGGVLFATFAYIIALIIGI